jgi:uncharacterized protein (DUF58 family)
VRPTGRLLTLLALWATLGLAAAVWPLAFGLWAGFGLVLLLMVAVDALLLNRLPLPVVSRSLPAALAVGEWHDVRIRLDSRARAALSVWDHTPPSWEVEGMPRPVQLTRGQFTELVYRVRPRERGRQVMAQVDLLLNGKLGLLVRRALVEQADTVRVYPNFREVSKYALLALDNRLASMGIHMQRRRGEGTEFFQLREYRKGDTLRQIDWKAVSRRRQLISRDYREEQNQRVIFLLDCGRRMHAREEDALSHFDHALNALLLLSYVALRQGDQVGLMTFSGHNRWLPPRSGTDVMTSLLNGVYDLATTTAPSDYSEAAYRLATRQRRRALVVLVTNLRDDDASDLPAALAPLRRKHLVLLASLREPALRHALAAPVQDYDSAVDVAAAHHYLRQRKATHKLMASRKLMTLDCEPAELPVGLVNKYLEIKRSGVL